jgi:alkanesulfonate monooxygenase SsuD/methylene tetrahydromethanopterin reductase-like flavin-dependent oxidoreductase (luciferase family)
MKFGVFYEHQLPRPWEEEDEHRLYREALEQIQLADELGLDYAWEVEHHFLEEYSHSPAPEVFLANAAGVTEDIRLGHGVKLMPPAFNHPARVAEQVATLDLVSDGRVEWGTGESASRTELEGFGVPPGEKKDMWRETTEQVANMLTMEPYPGHDGEYFEMPARNVIPKPVQDPHPPLWVACSSRETIEYAARNGMGALANAFVSPEEAEEWVDRYYEVLREECVPIGHTVNPNVAMVAGFACHHDWEEARRRGAIGLRYFQYALEHYYVRDEPHTPGHTDIWAQFEAEHDFDELVHDDEDDSAIGTPEDLTEYLREMATAGVDQVVFLQQAGTNEHEHICESLELFAEAVMPEFHEGEAEREAEKRAELEPYIEEAFERKEAMEEPDERETPSYRPYT